VQSLIFGPPDLWPRNQDAVCSTREFDAELTLEAYRAGLFPMPISGMRDTAGVTWWSPLERGILEPSRLRVSKSLKKSAKRYRTTIDAAFDRVLAACADPSRPYGWIDAQIRAVYTELHQRGVVHSVECWDAEDRLAGGLYGVSLGGLFAGESMWHDPQHGRDASKVALLRLTEQFSDSHPSLIDVQWLTPHLATLGAQAIPREAYLARLDDLLRAPGPAWGR
jgi:leucyl/phenylalanyl-tRNA--protein transferase